MGSLADLINALKHLNIFPWQILKKLLDLFVNNFDIVFRLKSCSIINLIYLGIFFRNNRKKYAKSDKTNFWCKYLFIGQLYKFE